MAIVINGSGTVSGLTAQASDVELTDSTKVLLGTGDDLQIYHSGSHSFIDDVGTGNLNIRGENIIFQKADGSEKYMDLNADGAVELWDNNVKKLETTSTGVDVTGFVSTTVAPYWQTVRDDTGLTTETFTYGANSHLYWVTFTSTNATADMFIYGGRLHSGQWYNYGWKFGNEVPATFTNGTTVSDTNNTYQMSWNGGINQIIFSRSSGSTNWGIHVKNLVNSK